MNGFHILSAGVFDSRQRYRHIHRTKQRTVRTYELEYFLHDGGVSHVNQEAHTISAGNVLFAGPGDVRYSELHINCLFLHFTVTDEALLPLLNKIGHFHALTDRDRAHQTMSAMVAGCFSSSKVERMTACARLLLFLTDLADAQEQSGVLATAEQYIAAHCCDNLTTESIAAACHISVSHLHRLFKATHDRGPMEYTADKRMECAKQMLLGTERSITDIAFACGYNSQSYFSFAFKRHTGMAPAAFRKTKGYLSP